jgi:hypothetical protein
MNMKSLNRTVGLLATALCLALPIAAQSAGKAATGAPMVKALESAMNPGEGQKRLEPMIGTFSVKILTWVTPNGAPVESTGTSVNAWVLGGRYVQSMLAAEAGGAPFSGIGYMAYDNVGKSYQATWMDNGSTAMTWFRGNLDASGKSATLKATMPNALTGKPSPVELRLSIEPNGSHVTQLWGQGAGAKMVKLMELQYTKTK